MFFPTHTHTHTCDPPIEPARSAHKTCANCPALGRPTACSLRDGDESCASIRRTKPASPAIAGNGPTAKKNTRAGGPSPKAGVGGLMPLALRLPSSDASSSTSSPVSWGRGSGPGGADGSFTGPSRRSTARAESSMRCMESRCALRFAGGVSACPPRACQRAPMSLTMWRKAWLHPAPHASRTSGLWALRSRRTHRQQEPLGAAHRRQMRP